jgi:hypothetical protein
MLIDSVLWSAAELLETKFCRTTDCQERRSFWNLYQGTIRIWNVYNRITGFVDVVRCREFQITRKHDVYNYLGFRSMDKVYKPSDSDRSTMLDRIETCSFYLWPPLWSRGQNSWLQIQRSGFDSQRYKIFWEVVCLERSPLSLVSKIEELLEKKKSGGSGL